jgi:hypothetical protein
LTKAFKLTTILIVQTNTKEVELKKETRSAIDRLFKKNDPEMEKLKRAILNIFDGGGSLHILQIEEALAGSGISIHEDLGDKKGAKIKMALSELSRTCELYPIACYDERADQVVAFCFAPMRKILSEDVLEVPVEDAIKAAEDEDTKTL